MDDHAKWNRVVAMRMREEIAFKKATNAREMLVDFIHTATYLGESCDRQSP